MLPAALPRISLSHVERSSSTTMDVHLADSEADIGGGDCHTRSHIGEGDSYKVTH